MVLGQEHLQGRDRLLMVHEKCDYLRQLASFVNIFRMSHTL